MRVHHVAPELCEGGFLPNVCAVTKRILIVDDEVALLRIMREALAASFRCEVDTSPTPDMASSSL